MYIAYAHLKGIYVFFKSKQKTDTMTLDHSAVSTNTVFRNMQTTSLTFTSTSLTPAVLLYSLQAMFTVTSSSVSQPWPHMLAPYVPSQLLHILPHTLLSHVSNLSLAHWPDMRQYTHHDRFRAKCPTTSCFPNTLLVSSAWLPGKSQQR